MKFGQVIEYNMILFFKILCRKWGKEASSRLFVFLKKPDTRYKYVVCSFFEVQVRSFNMLWYSNLAYHKNKLYQTLEYWFRNLLNFDFLEKTLGIVSPSHFIKYLVNKKSF